VGLPAIKQFLQLPLFRANMNAHMITPTQKNCSYTPASAVINAAKVVSIIIKAMTIASIRFDLAFKRLHSLLSFVWLIMV
jgi:hypothetical protein